MKSSQYHSWSDTGNRVYARTLHVFQAYESKHVSHLKRVVIFGYLQYL